MHILQKPLSAKYKANCCVMGTPR